MIDRRHTTPAPWQLAEGTVQAGQVAIAEIKSANSAEEQLANGLLIAAALDLLTANKQVEAATAIVMQKAGEFALALGALEQARQLAKAAAIKAEG